MPSYLLRVSLSDRPGSLGALAVALGSVGADILSLDVVDRAAGTAVDDVVVELPAGALPDTLITSAEKVPGVRVESIRPYAGFLDTHRELELVDKVAHAADATDSPGSLQVLVDEAPPVLRVSWALVIARASSGLVDLFASSSAPETVPTDVDWLPLTKPVQLPSDGAWVPPSWQEWDTTLAAAPLGDPQRALLLGRTGGPAFRPSELARLGYLTGIVATVLT